MSDFAAELKSRADLGAVVGETVALKRAGNGWIGLCPFHEEKTPSFHVHAERNFFYCFGCQAHGDVYEFVMRTHKLTFPEAVAWLAERLGVSLPPRWSGGDSAAGPRGELLRLHAAAAEFFAARLRADAGARARAYLAGRGVGEEARERFQLGHAPAAGRALVEFLSRRDFSARAALAAGLCQPRRAGAERGGFDAEAAARGGERAGGAGGDGEGEGVDGAGGVGWEDVYDRFRDRVVFPIHDEQGRVIAFGGRALESDPARPAPKYLNSPETPLYSKGRVVYNLHRAREAARRLGYFILVEGYLDCLTVFMNGFENVVASCGTALTAAQIALLAKQARNILMNFDPDAAGQGGAEKSVGLLLEAGCKIRVLTLPEGLDPDQFLRRRGREAYAEALRRSEGFFAFLGERARRAHDLRRAEGRVAALNYLLPYVNRVPEPMLRAELCDELAQQLGMENALERQQLRRAAQLRQRAVAGVERAPDLLPAEALLLRALLLWDEQRSELARLCARESLLEGLASASLVAQMAGTGAGADAATGMGEAAGGPQSSSAATGEAETAWDLAAFTSVLSPEDRQLVAEVLLRRGDPLDAASVEGAMEALRDRQIERQRRALRREVGEAEASGDAGKVGALLRQLRDLDRRLGERAFSLRRGAAAG